MVHLACLAYEIFGQDRLLEIATGVGWNAWESAHGPIDLCCGLAGRGYALLMLYRCTGDPCWLSRARHLALSGAERATAQESLEHPPYALYKGALGLVLLLADLEEPGAACMPVFGDEGWSRQAGGGPHLPATAPGPPDA
jgi:serine/threonine-protein kinase